MEGSPIDIVIIAPLAPILGVLIFWLIQLIFIESEKFLLTKLRAKHESLCRFTNFLGILFQTICHVLGYTVTKSGISDFYISISYGKVAPKKEKKGIFEWIANAFLFVGPFFIPALLIFICLILLKIKGLEIIVPSTILGSEYTFMGQITIFGASLQNFTTNFFGFLGNIDLLHPGHFGFLILLIFFGLGIRPSYIGEKKREKVDILYDLKNVWSLISSKPLYIISVFIFFYLFFYVSLITSQNFYVALFSIFGWLSIISITALILCDAVLLLIKNVDEIPGRLRYLPFFILPTSYILMRLLFSYFPIDFTNSVSILTMILSCVLIIIILKFRTNKFKTKTKMKHLRGKDGEEKDERKRRFFRKRSN